MRKLINESFKQYYRYRIKSIEQFMQHPDEAQYHWLNRLISSARRTEWGKLYDFKSIRNSAQFAERIPVQDYESLKPYIERMMYGERDILWPGYVRWFSKSSGTTSDKSKFIPVSRENLSTCHIKGTWDTMTIFYNQRPDARQFECKSLIMGGSLDPFPEYPKTMRGDVSAIMLQNMPWVGKPFVTPSFEIALLANFEEKIEQMAQIISKEPNLVMIGGVPTWTVVLFRRVLELTGKSNLLEVWPNLRGYIHGAVSFTPYRDQFKAYLPSNSVSYQEIYNASEGYFAIQNDFSEQDMLLLLDN
ncbi:MAG: GH3 auxin-responsive promoter family protein, partial [Phaeodactylibacter sp.]|nr:GH3 auxin-responsive promoter family protein [Phaeodactylibacter sp.]